MGCFSKFFLTALNFLVFAVGVAVIVLASLILSHGQDFQALVDKGSFTVPIILLIIGVIILLIGFFGCFGAIRESPCLLYTYATIVLCLLIAQIAVIVYGSVEKGKIQDVMSEKMIKVMATYGHSDEGTASLDTAQHGLQCCGVFNYTDWGTGGAIHKAIIADGGDVPKGCCRHITADCNKNIFGASKNDIKARIYTDGCFTKFWDIVEGESIWMIVGAVVLGLVQLACVVIACGIGKRSSQRDHVY